jgi:ketosteroid isomerase-like protein
MGQIILKIILEGNAMRMSYAFILIAALAAPSVAMAGDENLRQEVEKIGAAYADSFNKQDAAGIATLYMSGGVHVNAMGARADIAEFYSGLFKAGFNHFETNLDEVWPVNADTLVAMGKYRLTGKNQSSAPIEAAGIWTATDVRQGGKWKVQMISAIPNPPQPPN